MCSMSGKVAMHCTAAVTFKELTGRHELVTKDPVVAVQGCHQPLEPEDSLRQREGRP